MKSLNIPSHIERHRELIIEFKRFIKINQNIKLPPFDNKLHGYDCNFKLWLSLEKGITDLDLYLKSLEVNTSLRGEYHGKGTSIYSKR